MTRRFQTGQLVKAGNQIFIRYYDPSGKRVMKKLCRVDKNRTQKQLKEIQTRFMSSINATQTPDAELTIHQFWPIFMEHLKTQQRPIRPSTEAGYQKLWNGLLADHFAGKTLAEYRAHHGFVFLDGLAKRKPKPLGRRSIAHIRSLCSSLFALATSLGHVQQNPWREVKSPSTAEPKTSTHYTWQQAQVILNRLEPDLRAKTAFGLCWMLALRPGELSALRFEDFDETTCNVQRSAWRGKISQTKTSVSAKKPLIRPARELLEAWRLASGSPSEGWLFPSRDSCLDMPTFANRVIKPLAGKSFTGLYGCRRGILTELTAISGNALGSRGMGVHKTIQTTINHYTMEMPEETLKAMRMLEEKIGRG